MDLTRYRGLFASEATRHLDAIDRHVASVDQARQEKNAIFRAFHTVKGMSATMNVPAMVLVAHAVEEVCHRVVTGEFPVDDELLLVLAEGSQRLRVQLAAFIAGKEPLSDGAFEDRVRDFARTGGTYAFTLVQPIEDDAPLPPPDAPRTRLEHAQGSIAEVLSALGRIRARVGSDASGEALGEIDRAEAAVRYLYGQLVVLRTVPIASIVPGLRRQVQAVARRHGKAVSLVVQGEELEVDGELLSRLHGALVALLNNALVHGIESPETRLAMGKLRAGELLLAVERVGRALVFRVEDDGRGFDVAQLGRHGADPLQAAFRDGVTTAAQLSEDAGRGMGLPAVREVVQSVGGTLGVTSKPGEGTRVRIVAPVLADLVRLVLVEQQGETVAYRAASIVHRDATHLCFIDGREVAYDRVVDEADYLVSAPPFPLHRLRHLHGTTVAPDGRICLVVE
ncbi:MAG: Hpt domain-containing protein [Deltaproteobacteria bacterium]|nr:Hpt domain-containing protein [Deltaproteobacteria bacterium]